MKYNLNPRVIFELDDPNYGYGDSILFYYPLFFLSQKYNVNVLTHNSRIIQFLKLFKKSIDFDLIKSRDFYSNDLIRIINPIYFNINRFFRPLPEHAIFLMLDYVDPYFNGYLKKDFKSLILPELDICSSIFDRVYSKIVKNLKYPIILVSLVDSNYLKMLSDSKYYSIVDELLKIGTVVYLGDTIRFPDRIHPKAINLIGKTSLAETLALIKFADLVFCGDTFVQHAAALMKTPAVVYFCGTTPMDFGYPFFSNIFNPELVPCQLKCSYFTGAVNCDLSNSKCEMPVAGYGNLCSFKACESYITPNLVSVLCEKELSIDYNNRDWTFYSLRVTNFNIRQYLF